MAGNLVFTNNVLDKLRQKNIAQDFLSNIVNYHDKSFPGQQPGTTVFQKDSSLGFVTIIAKRIDSNKWLILSFWIKNQKHSNKTPNDPRYKNASFWKRVWLDIISTFGL